jgi:hypothetical protein
VLVLARPQPVVMMMMMRVLEPLGADHVIQVQGAAGARLVEEGTGEPEGGSRDLEAG